MSIEIGKCLCGKIEVQCNDLPKNVVACFCEDCQKVSGFQFADLPKVVEKILINLS